MRDFSINHQFWEDIVELPSHTERAALPKQHLSRKRGPSLMLEETSAKTLQKKDRLLLLWPVVQWLQRLLESTARGAVEQDDARENPHQLMSARFKAAI